MPYKAVLYVSVKGQCSGVCGCVFYVDGLVRLPSPTARSRSLLLCSCNHTHDCLCVCVCNFTHPCFNVRVALLHPRSTAASMEKALGGVMYGQWYGGEEQHLCFANVRHGDRHREAPPLARGRVLVSLTLSLLTSLRY